MRALKQMMRVCLPLLGFLLLAYLVAPPALASVRPALEVYYDSTSEGVQFDETELALQGYSISESTDTIRVVFVATVPMGCLNQRSVSKPNEWTVFVFKLSPADTPAHVDDEVVWEKTYQHKMKCELWEATPR